MRDSINNEETQKATAMQQAKYAYEKQKTIDDAEYDKLIAIEKKEREKQQIILWALAIVIGLIVLLLIFIFNRLTLARKQKSID